MPYHGDDRWPRVAPHRCIQPLESGKVDGQLLDMSPARLAAPLARMSVGGSLRSRVQLFGLPRILGVHGELPFRPERRFRLLAILAVRQSWVTRDWLARLFWPERDTASARANLRKLIHETRQLGVEGLDDTPAGLKWTVETDLAEFRGAMGRDDWLAAGRVVCGPLLQGLESGRTSSAFDAWLACERAEAVGPWRDASLRAMAQSAVADAEVVAECCSRLLDADPFDEDALAVWLRIAYAAGRPANAEAAYRLYARQLADELGLEPSVRLRGLAADPGRAAVQAQSAGEPAPLLGRAQELEWASALLARADCRLVTIIGPGGAGKTRFARHLAGMLVVRYVSTWFISLEDVATPAALPGRIADCLHPPVALGDDAVASLSCRWPQGPTLLVLDGFEHLVDSTAFVERLLARLPELQIVVTSRERLESDGEHLVPLSGLGAPHSGDGSDSVCQHPAVRLFAERAGQVLPAFGLAAVWREVRDICVATEGLPLALELAAAWVRLMPCADIARDLASGAALLSSGSGPRSMNASFEHSWSLLTPSERGAFTRLAVFRGGFGRAAALQVADVNLPVLANLLDKSMLRVDARGRFDRHALLDAWACRKLREIPALQRQMTERHGRWFLAYLLRNHGVLGGGHANKRAAIAAERDNILQAWREWIVSSSLAETEAAADVLSWFHVVEGRLPDGIALFDEAARTLGDTSVAGASLRAHQAWLELWMEHYARAEQMGRSALATLDAAGHSTGSLLALRTLAHVARRMGRHAESVRLLGDALRRARRSADARIQATLLDAAAMAWTMLGQYARAKDKLHSALALNELVGNDAQRMYNEFNLSQAHAFGGDAAAALFWAEAALQRARRIGYRFFEPYALCQRASASLSLGHLVDAAVDVDAALREAGSMGGSPGLVWAYELRARVALAAGNLDAAWAAVREGAIHAQGAGNILMGASLVPAAAGVARAAGLYDLAEGWLARLLACDRVQVPVQAEARAMRTGPARPVQGATDVLSLLKEIAHTP